MKIIILLGALLISGCVVNPYYEETYRTPYPSVRYYEPCCSSSIIIRSESYGRGYRSYGPSYRPHNYYRHNNWRPSPNYGHPRYNGGYNHRYGNGHR